jgi:hypothetical protein
VDPEDANFVEQTGQVSGVPDDHPALIARADHEEVPEECRPAHARQLAEHEACGVGVRREAMWWWVRVSGVLKAKNWHVPKLWGWAPTAELAGGRICELFEFHGKNPSFLFI